MNSPLRSLRSESIRALIAALDSGRLTEPFTELALRRFFPPLEAAGLFAELGWLTALGLTTPLLREVLMMLSGPPAAPAPELVWTGPEPEHSATRDTGVVMRELFRRAQHEVTVVGFAVHQGKRIFEELAHRMDTRAELMVKLYLNIARAMDDRRSTGEVLESFVTRFRQHEWPGRREPEIYYDPRPLHLETGVKRSSLHAKCVVVDRRHLFVTSANLTEAGQDRNIELGVLLSDEGLANRVHEQFEALARSSYLKPLRFPDS